MQVTREQKKSFNLIQLFFLFISDVNHAVRPIMTWLFVKKTVLEIGTEKEWSLFRKKKVFKKKFIPGERRVENLKMGCGPSKNDLVTKIFE